MGSGTDKGLGAAAGESAADGIPRHGDRAGVLHPRRRDAARDAVGALPPDQGAGEGGRRPAAGAAAARCAAHPHGPRLPARRRTGRAQRPAGPPRGAGSRRGQRRRAGDRHGARSGGRRPRRGGRADAAPPPAGDAAAARVRHRGGAARADGARHRRCGRRLPAARLVRTLLGDRRGADRAGRPARRSAVRPRGRRRAGGAGRTRRPGLGALRDGTVDRRAGSWT